MEPVYARPDEDCKGHIYEMVRSVAASTIIAKLVTNNSKYTDTYTLKATKLTVKAPKTFILFYIFHVASLFTISYLSKLVSKFKS